MGKTQLSLLRAEPFAALFCISAFYLPPPSLYRDTGSMFFYGNAAGTAVQDWFNRRIITARKGKGWRRHFFHQMEPN